MSILIPGHTFSIGHELIVYYYLQRVLILSRRHQWVLGYHYNINVIIARLKLATNKNIGQNPFSRELIQHHFCSYTIVSLTLDI